jgi:hypothetical protein
MGFLIWMGEGYNLSGSCRFWSVFYQVIFAYRIKIFEIQALLTKLLGTKNAPIGLSSCCFSGIVRQIRWGDQILKIFGLDLSLFSKRMGFCFEITICDHPKNLKYAKAPQCLYPTRGDPQGLEWQ